MQVIEAGKLHVKTLRVTGGPEAKRFVKSLDTFNILNVFYESLQYSTLQKDT